MFYDTLKSLLDNERKPVLQDYGFQPPLILYYHTVSDESLPHIKHLYKYKDIEFFMKDLDYLASHYTIISPQDLLDKKRVPGDSCLITFDDGFTECRDIIAPILLEKGIEAAFFLNSGFIGNKDMYFRNQLSIIIDALENNQYSQTQLECCNALFPDHMVDGHELKEAILTVGYDKKEIITKALDILELDINDYLKTKKPYMDIEDIKWLKDNGFHIGSHSIDHTPLHKLPFDEQVNQMIESTDYVQNTFDLPYRISSLPHNDRGLEGAFFHQMRQSLDLLFGGHGLTHKNHFNYFKRVNPEHSRNIRFFLEKQYGIQLVKKYL